MSKGRKGAPGVYLVTGANRGIGLAFARNLSERGDRVIATARNPEKAPELSKLAVQVEKLDVSDQNSVTRLADRLKAEPIDVLINNAGIGESGPGLARIDPEDLRRAFLVNAVGPVLVTQALLPNLRAGNRRVVVNLSSGLASVSGNKSGGWHAYRASKAALNQITRTMAAELAREQFAFVALSPGWVRTDMGGPGATLTPDQSVAAMLKIIDHLTPSDTGRFLDQRGKDVAW